MSETTKTPYHQLFIGGEWVDPLSERTFATYNPATGETIAQVAEGGEADVDRAVKAAHKAHESGIWANMPAAERSRILNKAADLFEAAAGEFAALETQNNGKPINESTYIDIPMAIDCWRYYASTPRFIAGQALPVNGMLTYTLKEPVGVVGQIIPWNFPMMMAAWKMAPALAAGNSIVLKPAEQTPLTALKLAQILKEAGVPDGVVNVVTGDGEGAGAALVRHPGVNKIAFTGSTEVGIKIMQNAAPSLKRVSLELGGKAPNVVFADADLEQAVRAALFAIYFNQGQICTAGSRLLLQDSIHDAFMEQFLAKVATLRVGDPTQPTTQVGALVSKEQYDRVQHYVKLGQEQGAKLAFAGQAPDQGYFVAPTVFTDVQRDMAISQEEIFGPVLSVLRFKDDADAVQLANSVKYGLVSAVWTRDIKRAHNFARQIQAGYVWINTYNVLPTEAPFGGYKQSGFGRELGFGALDMYTETKNVCVDLNEASPVTGWYGV